MSNDNIGRLSATCRPTKRMMALAFCKHGPKMAANIHTMVEDAIAVNALAGMLDRAMTESTSKDGRLDLKDMAARLIIEMRENQK